MLLMQTGDSLTDVLGVVSVYCGCKMNWAAAFLRVALYVVSLQHLKKPFITTVSPICLQPG